jgi:anti-sigma-K factor RskA
MNDEQRDLAAGAALGALSPDELARFVVAEARTPGLAAQIGEYHATVAVLEAGLARERPPLDLFERVLARIDGEAPSPSSASAATSETTESPRPSVRDRARRVWPAFATGAMAAAVATVLVLTLTGDDLGSPDARAAVNGTDEFPGVHGEARLYRSAEDDGILAVDLLDMPAPAPGEHYEVWVLRREGGGAMEAVGSFSAAGSSVDLELPLPGAGDYEAVDISVEPDGGPAAHSGRSLAGGRFEPAQE